MSSLSFDPSQITCFGTAGQETARRMAKSAQSHGLSVAYDSNAKKFTIPGSSGLNQETVQAIFDKNTYQGWRPQVSGDTDEVGNKIVTLIPALIDSTNGILIFERSVPEKKRMSPEWYFPPTTPETYTRCQEKGIDGIYRPIFVGSFIKKDPSPT